MAIYIKHSTQNVLLVNSKVSADQKCCCNPPALTVTCNAPATISVGQYEEFTATLTPLIPNVAPTGTVLWKFNGAKITAWPNPVPMHTNGTAHTPSVGVYSGDPPATNTWSAEYSGDANYAAVSGSFVQHIGTGSGTIPSRIRVNMIPHVTVYGNPLQYFNYPVVSTDPAMLNFSGEIKMQIAGGNVTEFYGATDPFGGCSNPRNVCSSVPSASFQSSLILTNGAGSVNALIIGCGFVDYNCGDRCADGSYALFKFVNSNGTQQATVDNGGPLQQSSPTLYVYCQ